MTVLSSSRCSHTHIVLRAGHFSFFYVRERAPFKARRRLPFSSPFFCLVSLTAPHFLSFFLSLSPCNRIERTHFSRAKKKKTGYPQLLPKRRGRRGYYIPLHQQCFVTLCKSVLIDDGVRRSSSRRRQQSRDHGEHQRQRRRHHLLRLPHQLRDTPPQMAAQAEVGEIVLAVRYLVYSVHLLGQTDH